MALPSVNVPNVPGVPSVNFAGGIAGVAGNALSVLSQDAIGIFAGFLGIQLWGIFLGGVPVIICDNIVAVDYRNSWAIGDYPIEEGGFQSYDKVATPFQTRVVMSAGGSIAYRAAFIASVDAIAGDTNLYDVVTPEKVLLNCNVNRVEWARQADRGAGLVVVEVGLEEIRITASQSLQNTKDPTSQAQTNNGPTQTQFPTAAQQAAVVNYTPVPAGQTPRGGN